eukprot:TRINITY_DN1933_c0_g1_i3.p1 TRINITY_DN1933_c0_g1~~TRINITY_DN1933_c0_g1_i3.p1  ORF type:complete len:154 (-),score=1.04 TRINITY_DN1933_c0_g1_i3:7-468(-)
MVLRKMLFPVTQSGFNMWFPSLQSKTASIALFIHYFQYSELLGGIINSESFLCSNSSDNPLSYLETKTNWPWLRSTIDSINHLKIIPKIYLDTLMWSTKLKCEVVINIDQMSGQILARKPSSSVTFICNPEDLRPRPTFTSCENPSRNPSQPK